MLTYSISRLRTLTSRGKDAQSSNKGIEAVHYYQDLVVFSTFLSLLNRDPFQTTNPNFPKSSIPSVTRQKGESQNGCFKKTKHAKSSKETKI